MQFKLALTTSLLSASAAWAASNAQPADVAGSIGQAVAQFQAAGLIPNPIKTEWLQPVAALNVDFGNRNAPLGSDQQVAQLQTRPTYSLNYSASSAEVGNVLKADTRYTVMFIDASYLGDSSGNGNVTRHQLSNNYTLNAQTGELENGSPVTRYAAPLPKSGDGPHRYIQLVATQSPNFKPPARPAQGSGVESWDLASYWTDAGLSKVVAMSYIQVQVGQGSKAQSTSAAPQASVAAASSSILAALGAVASATSTSATAPAATTSKASSAASFGSANFVHVVVLALAGLFGAHFF